MRLAVTFLLVLIFSQTAFASVRGTVSFPAKQTEFASCSSWKYRLVDRLKKKYGDHSRRVAALLAFPVFGIVGLHRIYLGTKPYVPVVYAATLGGCAGILPLADFFAIICSKKETFETFKNNSHVFMWAK
ncbi:MAG TPA: TM2 domain-containing protein [Bacteroidia bacterium]|jgi:hypothetical protein